MRTAGDLIADPKNGMIYRVKDVMKDGTLVIQRKDPPSNVLTDLGSLLMWFEA